MDEKEILKQLVKFNTIKDKENKEIMDYIEKILIEKGFKTEYRSKNLVMSIKGKFNLGFLGHTDTVKYGNDWSLNLFDVQEIDGKLYGLGTSDMKGGIAAIIQAVCNIDWEKCKTGIKLYFTYDEEIGFAGIKELIKRKEKFPETMIICEPTNNVVMNGSKGLLEFRLVFSGISVHSSTPDNGENAIEKCIGFLNELKEFYDRLKKDNNGIFETGTTMNIGKINGGKSINIVPNSCEVLIDFRVTKDKHIEEILNKICNLSKKYKCSYKILNNISPFINKGEKIVPANFITEASFIEAKNRYILGVGPVNAHKADEYITESSLEKLVKQYEQIIYKYCK